MSSLRLQNKKLSKLWAEGMFSYMQGGGERFTKGAAIVEAKVRQAEVIKELPQRYRWHEADEAIFQRFHNIY